MKRIPRADWTDSCERINQRIDGGAFLVDAQRRRVVRVDYAPMDDIIEVSVESGDRVIRLLLDRPNEVLVGDGKGIDASTVLMVDGDTGAIEIRHDQPAAASTLLGIPTQTEGAYFEG